LQDQLWLVSDRSAGCDVEAQATKLQYWRYDRERCWVGASLAELLAADDSQAVTTVFVHGNRIPPDEAFTKGWTAYRTLVRCADERPVRFIIWSWPSEAVRGPINDARVKACRTNPSGYYLSWFLDQLDPAAPVSLWGHSLGARVITGALHLLGGGEIDGHRLAQRSHATREPVQVVFLVAAIDSDWLLAGHYHGNAMSQVARMFLVNNGCDALLKRYHLIYADRGHEQALGYTGLDRGCVSEMDWTKVSQVDACCQVGRRHTFDGYLRSPDLVARMRPYLLFTPAEASPQAPGDLATIHRDTPSSLPLPATDDNDPID
jgi:hypothetical protein